MLISEIAEKGTEDIIRETDEYMLKSVLDSMILNIKDRLEHKQPVYTLEQVIEELNRQSDSVYIDPMDEDRRNNIIQAFEEHGMDIERGSGKITLGTIGDKAKDGTDASEQEKEHKKQEINSKAMDKLKNKSATNRDGGVEL